MTPVPDKDAEWLAWCKICQCMELYVTRGGFKGVQHCYGCGTETEIRGFKKEDIDRMIISSYCHWKKYPKLPYDWHTFTEEQKLKILFKKN